MLEDHIGGIRKAVLVAVAEIGDVLLSLLVLVLHVWGGDMGTYTARNGNVALPSGGLVARGKVLNISTDNDCVFPVTIVTLFLRHFACLSCVKRSQIMISSSLYNTSQPKSIQKWRCSPRRKHSQIKPFAINNECTWTCSPYYRSYRSIG